MHPSEYNEWYNHTSLHPVGMLALVALSAALLLLPRPYAFVPMIIAACFVSSAQRLVVVSLDFTVLRILVLVGGLRLLLWNEIHGLRWRPVDVLLLCWGVSGTVIMTLQLDSFAAFVGRLGWFFDAAGMYFFFRLLIRDEEDVRRLITWLCIISVPVAIAFVFEYATRRNLFSIFGGVPEHTVVREGRPRCQGAFSHPILAGCFWASLLPIMFTGWWGDSRQRLAAAIGVPSALIIVVASMSSTPAMGVVLAVLGWLLFPLRRWMRWVRWGLLGLLIGLHFSMEKPVWHLLSRVDLVGGSTGWHRYYLIDEAIRHFNEWWLLGTPSTAHWGWWLIDVTNQYVLEGVNGGLLTLLLFIGMVASSYASVGRIWRVHRASGPGQMLGWGLGVSLFIHTITFLAVSYFGQILLIWFLLLAVIASLDPGRAASGLHVLAWRAAARRDPPRGAPLKLAATGPESNAKSAEAR